MNEEKIRESLDLEIAKKDYEENISDAAKRTEYQIQFANSILRNLQFVNGGAIISLLTFLGNGDKIVDQEAMKIAFM